MNKRLALFFRGQTHDFDPSPMLFRKTWTCFDTNTKLTIDGVRNRYWKELEQIGKRVYTVCDSSDFGLPRWRGLRDIREVQWAVVQHYGLWPTPLIDLSTSLRVAASFAMDFSYGEAEQPRQGYIYVVGMPVSTESITFNIDEHITLARLYSACPPVAERPHYQEGYLAGRFPIYSMNDKGVAEKSLLTRRLIALFKIEDKGSFWDEDFPMMSKTAIYPDDDRLLKRFIELFGSNSQQSMEKLAKF